MRKRQIEPIYKDIGERLRRLRESKGMTQAELAKRVRLNRTSVVNFESGRQRLPLHKINAIARVLGRAIFVRFMRRT